MLLLCAILPSAWAAPIVSVSDDPVSGIYLVVDDGASNPGIRQYLRTSWSQADSYQNVSISALLFRNALTSSPGTAFLTSTNGDYYEQDFTFADLPVPQGGQPTQLFSGLTLGPGTYTLTLWGQDGRWAVSDFYPNILLGAGVSLGADEFSNTASSNPANPPASTFDPNVFPNRLLYSVTGDVSTVPEPSSALLIGFGLGALVLIRRTRIS